MLSTRSINPDTLELLRSLSKLPSLAGTRLVGGTSLALQYGHRISVDLDFFGALPADESTLIEELRTVGEVSGYKHVSPKIRLCSINNVKVDIVDYSVYPWIDETVTVDGLHLASPLDIAAMKINAVEGRGSKKDFIDIYELLQHYSLDEILNFYARKYPEHSIFRALMSLAYFDDADAQIPPKTFGLPDWDTIKQYILDKVSAYSLENR